MTTIRTKVRRAHWTDSWVVLVQRGSDVWRFTCAHATEAEARTAEAAIR